VDSQRRGLLVLKHVALIGVRVPSDDATGSLEGRVEVDVRPVLVPFGKHRHHDRRTGLIKRTVVEGCSPGSKGGIFARTPPFRAGSYDVRLSGKYRTSANVGFGESGV